MIRVIDSETTGVDHTKDRVIQIGAVDLTKTGVINIQQTLVSLPEGMTVPPASSAVHHIIDADLVGAPAFDEAIVPYRGADFYVAHNAPFDAGFLAEPLGAKPEQWICTFKAALRAWPEAPGHSNQALRYWLGEVEPFGFTRAELPSHAAASDCIVTAAIFHRLLKTEGVTFALMKQWSAEPALFTVMNFGKHAGTRYDQIPADYLEWMIKQQDMDESKKFSARYWLNERQVAS